MAKRRSNFIVRAGADFSAITKAFGKLKKDIAAVTGPLKKSVQGMTAAMRGIVRGMTRTASAVGRLFNGFRRLVPLMGLFNKNARQASRSTGLLQRGLIRLALGMLVFGQIRKAMMAMGTTMRGLLSHNDAWNNSMAAVRTNLWTAFAPIWEAIMPALVAFANVLAMVTQRIAIFIALLSGRTYQSARDTGQALRDQAQAYREAGGAANAARKQLQGFDEINQAAQEDAGGGSGAGGGLDVSGVEPPNYAVINWLEELKYQLSQLKPNLDYFHNLGYRLAEIVAGWLDRINWERLQARASAIGKMIGAFLGGMVANDAFWRSLGDALVGGIRTALNFVNGFMRTFPFFDFGKRLAEIFNRLAGLLPELGTTLAKYINSIFDTINGFFTGVNWRSLGQNMTDGLTRLTEDIRWNNIADTLSTGLNGALTTLRAFITEYDFGRLGTQLSGMINHFIGNVEWDLAGQTLGAGLNSAIGFIRSAIQEFEWAAIGQALSTFINNFINEVEWKEIGSTISNFFKGALTFIRTAIDEFDWTALGLSIRDFLMGIDWLGIIDAVGGVITSAFKGAFDFLVGLVGEPIANALTLIAAAIGVVTAALTAFNTVLKVTAALKILLKSPIVLVVAAKATLVAIILQTMDYWRALGEVAASVWEFIKGVWGTVVGWFRERVIDPLRNGFSTFWEWLRKIPSTVWKAISSAWGVVAGWFRGNVIDPVAGFFTGMWDTVTGGARAAWEGIKGIFRAVPEWFKGIFQRAWEGVRNVFSTGGKIFKGIVEGITSVFKSVVNAIIGGINRVVAVPFDGINSALGRLRDISIFGLSPFGFLPTIPVPQIPLLAKGAVIPGGSPFAAILGDQPRGQTNIEAPLKTIELAVANVMNSRSNPHGMDSRGGSGADLSLMAAIVNGINDSIAASISSAAFAGNQSNGRDNVININGREFYRATMVDFLDEANREGFALSRI